MQQRKTSTMILRITEMGLLLALVLVLQLTGFAIPLPGTKISLVLIPITLGAMLLGPWAGALLGLAMGAVVLIGAAGGDAFTTFLFQAHPIMTVLICLVKSTAAGFLSGLTYRLLRKRNRIVSGFVAAAVTPIVNTGLFIVGCLIILDTIEAYTAQIPDLASTTAVYFLFIICAGLNFLLEFAANMLLAPTLCRLENVLTHNK